MRKNELVNELRQAGASEDEARVLGEFAGVLDSHAYVPLSARKKRSIRLAALRSDRPLVLIRWSAVLGGAVFAAALFVAGPSLASGFLRTTNTQTHVEGINNAQHDDSQQLIEDTSTLLNQLRANDGSNQASKGDDSSSEKKNERQQESGDSESHGGTRHIESEDEDENDSENNARDECRAELDAKRDQGIEVGSDAYKACDAL